jgi:phage protein D
MVGAKLVAIAKIVQMMTGTVGASGEVRGNPNILAGKKLEVKGVGQRFAKEYRVEKATHRIGGKDGYKTSFELKQVI